MALFEISSELNKYPETVREIQMAGFNMIKEILSSSTKSIANTTNMFLKDK
jgi:hypothetical protein